MHCKNQIQETPVVAFAHMPSQGHHLGMMFGGKVDAVVVKPVMMKIPDPHILRYCCQETYRGRYVAGLRRRGRVWGMAVVEWRG